MFGSRKTLIFAVIALSFVLAFSSIGSITFALDRCTTAADCYKGGSYYCTCNGAEKSYCIDGESWYRNYYHCSDHVVSNDLYSKYCVLSSSTSSQQAQYTCDNGVSTWNNVNEVTCNDGKDDDYDGTTDCSDSDCIGGTYCPTTTTTTSTTTTTTTTLATTTTVSTTTTTAGPASITVTSPNGGETLRVGSTVTISWTSSGVNYVYLDLLDSSGTVKVGNLVNVNGNPGTASWSIPSYITLGSYRVRVSTCTSIADRNSCYENSKNIKDTSDGLVEIKSSACTDTDNGSDTNTKGTVTIDSVTYTDYCTTTGVVEYYCSSSQATTVSSSTQACTSGYTCSDGHCIAQTTTTTTVPPYSGACTDSDNGINSNTNGVGVGIYSGAAAGYHAIYGQEPNPNTPKSTTNSYSTFYDYCATPTQLNEAFCNSDGKLSSYGYQCSYGCNNGVCLPAPATTTTTTTPKKVDGSSCTSGSECYSGYCTGGYCGSSGCPSSSKTCPDGTVVSCPNYKDTQTNSVCRTDCYIPSCPLGTTTTYYTATTMACSSAYPSYCNNVDQCKGSGNNWCTNSGGGYCTRESCPYCQSSQSWNCYNEKDCKEIGKSNWCYPSGGGAGYCTTANCPVTGPPTTITPSACGNGFCEYGETPDSCISDCRRNVCPAVSYTDDLKRKCYANGGNIVTPPPAPGSYCSPQPTCSICGNNICEVGETTATCAQDCGKPVGGFVCGNNMCEHGETSFSCPADCTQISFCGNLICEPGEERSCPGDCKDISSPPGFYCPAQAKEYSKPTWDIASGSWCCTEKGGKGVGACSGSVQGTDRAFLERCVKKSGLELYVYINPDPGTAGEESLNTPSIKQATLLGNGFSVLKDVGRVINCYDQSSTCAQKNIRTYPTWVIYNIPYGRILEPQELGTLTSCSQFEGPGGTGHVPPPSDVPSFMFTTDPIEFLSAEALRHIRAELPPAFIDSICKNSDDIKEEIKRRTLYELSVRGNIADMCTELQKGAAQCDREIEFRCQDMKKRADEFCSGREECRSFIPTDSMIDACKNSGGSFVVEKDQTGCANIPRCQQSTEKGVPTISASGAFVLRNGEVLSVATGLQIAEPISVETFDRGSLCSTFTEKARFVCNELPRQCKAVKERAANCNPDKLKPELVAEKVADRVTTDLCRFKDFKTVKDVSQISVLPVVLSSDKKLTADQITKVRGLTIKFDDAPLNLAGVYIYRGTAAPNRLGDLRRLDFLSDVDVDHVELSSAPAEKGNELKNFVGKLETMKELDKIPTSLQPRVSESQNDILEVSADVEQIKNKSAGVGYAIQQFFGMVAEQERKDSALLKERAEKLREIATNLQLIADSVGNVDARASLSEQISFLKEQADQYDKDAQAKEAWSGGILSYFSQLFSGGSTVTTTTMLPA